jgi:hypothetical protein
MRRLGAPANADPNDPAIKAIFSQAVNWHNQNRGTHLTFVSVSNPSKQVVSGFNFKGTVSVRDAFGSEAHYNVTVWQKAGGRSTEVTNFARL